MKKIISFEKKVEFPSMIGEITSISLEHDLKFINEVNVEGMLILTGTYKLTEASRLEEPFSYELPTEIVLGERLDMNSAKVEIDDFYYEIENDYNLICHIDIKVEGVEIVDIDIQDTEPPFLENNPIELRELNHPPVEIDTPKKDDSNRECDGDINDESQEERIEESMNEINETTVTSIFENINDSEETYATYSVYIIREEESIQSIVSKYKTTKEELEKYNNLSNLSIGTKIIIPIHEQ